LWGEARDESTTTGRGKRRSGRRFSTSSPKLKGKKKNIKKMGLRPKKRWVGKGGDGSRSFKSIDDWK